MGEAKRRQSATAKMIAQHPLCCFCGQSRPTVTREHMPPRAMFDHSHRPDELVFPACQECNDGTRTADLVISIMSRWRFSDMTEIESEDHHRLVGRLRTQAPEIKSEWERISNDEIDARKHLERFIPLPIIGGVISIGPLTLARLNLFACKLVLALHFQVKQRALPREGCLWAFWKTKEDVAYGGLPDPLLRLLPGRGSVFQGRWDTRETFEFRHGQDDDHGTFACLARLRGGLMAGGFTVENSRSFDEDGSGWISPDRLLDEAKTPRFSKRDL